MVDDLERKKQLILSIVMRNYDKYLQSSEAVNTYSENYNKVMEMTNEIGFSNSIAYIIARPKRSITIVYRLYKLYNVQVLSTPSWSLLCTINIDC